jgi:hypothetical protein
MLLKVSVPREPRWPVWALAGLLALTQCAAGAVFAAPEPKDAIKKDAKKEAPPQK